MDILTFTLLLLVSLAIYRYFKKSLSFFEDKGIPYKPGWPIIGNVLGIVFRNKHLSEIVQDIYNFDLEAKYIGAFDFTKPIIVLRDLELIKSVAIKNFQSFVDHNVFVDASLDPLFSGNLLNMAGDRWKEARALLSPSFTSSKMKAMHELIVECGRNFVDYLIKLPDDEKKMIETKDLFTKFTSDAIATCVFGISVDSLKNPKNDFYVLGKEATNFDTIRFLKIGLAKFAPKIYKFFKIKFIRDRIVSFFVDIVDTTVKTRDEKGITRPDMIQLMMNARGKEIDHLKLDTMEMTSQAFIFFFGGFETTSTQMCIIAHELAINPDIQKKLQDEVDKVIEESDGNPSYEDIQNMLYLDAVFNESMRMHTQLSFIDRLCTKTFELPPALPGGKSFIVEPGMVIWIPAMAIHRDPKYYENPNTFDPDRYFGKKVSMNDVTNLAFGIGPRSCIGNRFAIMETKILFFYLLAKFNLVSNKNTVSPFVYSKTSFPIKPEGGFWLSVEARK